MKKISRFPQLSAKSRGFTLLEMMAAIFCSVLILGALYGVYVVSFKSYRRSIDQAELTQNARIALERISRDLRQTNRVTTDIPLDATDPLNPPATSIHFQDGHDTTQIRYIRYYLNGTDLRRQVLHYYFSSDPGNWVNWNAQDQFGNGPQESIDEDAVKADKISSFQAYGNKVITVVAEVTDGSSTFQFKTDVLGRNIQ